MNCETVCLVTGHDPVNFDPTGGDPFMGGPVMLTRCNRCGRDLPKSDAARLFNQYQGLLREEQHKHILRESELSGQREDALGSMRAWRGWAVFLFLAMAVDLIVHVAGMTL